MSEPKSYEPHLKLSIALAGLDAVLARLEAVRVLLAEVARPATPGAVSEMEGAALGAAQDVSEMERRDRRTVELIRAELRRVAGVGRPPLTVIEGGAEG